MPITARTNSWPERARPKAAIAPSSGISTADSGPDKLVPPVACAVRRCGALPPRSASIESRQRPESSAHRDRPADQLDLLRGDALGDHQRAERRCCARLHLEAHRVVEPPAGVGEASRAARVMLLDDHAVGVARVLGDPAHAPSPRPSPVSAAGGEDVGPVGEIDVGAHPANRAGRARSRPPATP